MNISVDQKKRITFSLLMGIITTGIISLILVLVNMGITDNFLFIWFKSWVIAYIVVIPAILLIAPAIQNKIDLLFDADKNTGESFND